MIFNSIYQPENVTGGVLGTSLIDLTTTSFAQMFANAVTFTTGGNYIAGALVYDQGAIWVCKLATSGANPPPTLPTLRNNWWEFVGSQGSFTWLAYADSPTGFVVLPSVSITGTAGQFSCTTSTVVVGDIITVTGTDTGTGAITGYNDKSGNYIVSATNGTTTFTLTKPDGSALVTTAGTTVGLTFTRYTLTNFTTDIADTRKYIGIAPNKTSATESVIPADYSWSRFVGTDGVIGVSPIFVGLSKSSVAVATDTNGDNGVFTGSGTEIRVVEGQTTLSFDGAGITGTGNTSGGTLAGTWKVASRVATNVTLGTTITDSGSFATISDITAMTADTASIVYNISGTTSSGTAFTTSATQTFVKVKGAAVDINPPGAPVGLALSSSTITTPSGDIQIKLTATWTANSEADLSYYEIQIKEGAGSYISYNAPSNSYEWLVKPNTSYTVQVRAIDKNDNRSAYGTPVVHTSTKDSVAPAVPTSIAAVATFKNIFLSWTNPADSDLGFVEVYRHTSDASGSSTKVGTVNAAASGTGVFTDSSGILNGTLYYYWLKAVDTSGNISALTTTSSSVLAGVVITGVAGQFSCTSNTLKIGQVVIISGALGGTGTINGYTTPKTYVISATNGTTTFTLVNTDGTPIVTTAGAPTGLTYTRLLSAAVPAAVGQADIIAGSITADRIRSGEITADIIAVPANQATTGGLNSSIQVGTTGVTIGNPIGLIENNPLATIISPGKIQINGATTLSSWIKGGDVTKIDGGAISANTISANKLTIGLRGVDISGIEFTPNVNSSGIPIHTASWTAGTISYANNNSIIVNQTNVPSGSITQARVTGTVTATYSGTTITLTYTSQAVPYFVGEKILVSGITATTNAPNGVFTVTNSTATQTTYTATATPTGTLAGTILLGSGQLQYIYWPKPPEGTVTATYSGTTITLTYPVQSSAPYIAGEQVVVSGITATTNAPNGTFTVVSSTTTQTVYTATAVPTGTLGSTISLNSSIPANTTITPTYSGTTITLTYPVQGSAPYTAGQQIVVSGITATTNAPNGTFIVVSSTTTQTVYTATAVPTGTLGTTVALGSGISGSRASGTANRENTIVLGTYAGGVDLVVNYGRTIIDGSQITTGTIRGDRVVANSITADKIDSRSLSIKDANGNIILAAGTALDYTNVGGTKPPSNATNGATIGTNLGGTFDQTSWSTYISTVKIDKANIGSIELVGTSNFSVKTDTNTALSRIEMNGQVIKIFEGANLRVKIGNLAA
jgi:hypothetical protein